MADKQKADGEGVEVKRQDPPTNGLGQVASAESSIRDAKHPDEKPDPATVAQVEEIKS